MRKSIAFLLLVLIFSPIAFAAEPPPPEIKGLWLTTDYPAATVRAGEETRFNLSLVNHGLAPQRASLTIDNAPQGWTVELRGAGREVAAALVDYNAKASLELKLKVPRDAKPGKHTLTVKATSSERSYELPIALTVDAETEAALTAEPKLPTLRGTPKSTFDFRVAVKNEAPRTRW
jgi:uncharacterized membrane protein